MRSRSSTTPHLPSYFLLITSIQLFHHQSYGNTFPVPNEPTKSEVHQIPSHPAIICIEQPHSFFFVAVLDGFPIDFYFVPYVAILSRPLFILILSPILFRHFQKFSKLLHPLRLQRPSIHLLPVMLQPRIIAASFFRIILRWIPLISFNKRHHLIIFCFPFLVLCHTSLYPLIEVFDNPFIKSI